MSKKSPQLRFKGFTDDWEDRNLKDILREFSTKSKIENEYRVLSSTNVGMEFRDGRVSGTSNLGYKIIKNGDLVLSPQNLWLGNININNIGTGLVSPSYKTFNFTDIDSSFIKPQLRTPKMLEEYKNSSTQGASVVRRNLEIDSFYQIKIATPSIKEQEKIGSFFKHLDSTISLHQRKLDLLKEQKKGYLQKMFPKNGEKVPELRFAGFADDWEERKLGDYVIIRSGWSPSNFDINNNANNLFIKVDDLNYSTRVQEESQVKVNILSKYKKMKKSSTIFPKRGAAIMTNKVRMLGEDSYMDTNMMALEPKGIDPEYLYTFINKTGLYKIADTSTIPQINNKHIEPYLLLIPSLEEQHKIGSFFKQLDETIALHQRKLELLKEQKKGFLQKMFI